MIQLTERATKKARQLATREGKPLAVRVGVRKGGCSGYSYFLEFDDAVLPTDEVTDLDGLKVICDEESLRVLGDTEIDYETSLLKGGFKFRIANAKSTCKCGDSFGV